MKSLAWLIVGMALLLGIGALLARRRSPAGVVTRDVDLRRKAPVSEREQGMYARLCRTFPDQVVLCQVAFSALLTSKQRATRNHFDRKVADFVLCSKAFVVLAVIELDDKTHQGKEAADSARDGWLKRAGYRVVRYANIPDEVQLLADFNLGTGPVQDRIGLPSRK